MHSGPLPPAGELALYDQALPGAAERIMSMAEQESENRRMLDRKLVDGYLSSGRRGQYFGFAVALISIAGFGFLAYTGKPLLWIVPAVFALASIVAVFMGQRSGQK
jgi:uncharacterized membrane protein